MPIACAAWATGGCAGPLSALDPAGPAAGAIGALWWMMLAGSVAILLLVLALLALAFVRQGPASARTWIVGGGIAFPLVVLTALLVAGLLVGERILPRDDDAALRVTARASQWRWDFGYPGGVASVGVLHIPVGRPVDVELTSADVIHSFWVPRLAGKMDAIPGRTNRLRIEAAAPGVYGGVCAEYCGIGHARHSLRVIAHDAAGWAAFAGEGAP